MEAQDKTLVGSFSNLQDRHRAGGARASGKVDIGPLTALVHGATGLVDAFNKADPAVKSFAGVALTAVVLTAGAAFVVLQLPVFRPGPGKQRAHQGDRRGPEARRRAGHAGRRRDGRYRSDRGSRHGGCGCCRQSRRGRPWAGAAAGAAGTAAAGSRLPRWAGRSAATAGAAGAAGAGAAGTAAVAGGNEYRGKRPGWSWRRSRPRWAASSGRGSSRRWGRPGRPPPRCSAL